MLLIEENLNEIRKYLSKMINDFKPGGKQKIQLTLTIDSVSKDSDETRTIHTKTDNIYIMIIYINYDNETDEII